MALFEWQVVYINPATQGVATQVVVDFGATLSPETVVVAVADTGVSLTSYIFGTMSIAPTRDSDEMEFVNFNCYPTDIVAGVGYNFYVNDPLRGAEGEYLLNITRFN